MKLNIPSSKNYGNGTFYSAISKASLLRFEKGLSNTRHFKLLSLLAYSNAVTAPMLRIKEMTLINIKHFDF